MLAYGKTDAEVVGLTPLPRRTDRRCCPTFLSFRFMVGTAMLYLLLAALAFVWRNRLEDKPFCCGRRSERPCPTSPSWPAGPWPPDASRGSGRWCCMPAMRYRPFRPIGGASLLAFIVVYSLLGVLDIYPLRKYACKGPQARWISDGTLFLWQDRLGMISESESLPGFSKRNPASKRT